MHNLLKIRPFRLEDNDQLVKNAAEDGHGVYFPSMVYEKDGEIVGYFSIAVPVVLTWQHSTKMTPLDSVKALGTCEGMLMNHPFMCIPCDPESPFMRFLPKAGYVEYTKPVKLFIKAR